MALSLDSILGTIRRAVTRATAPGRRRGQRSSPSAPAGRSSGGSPAASGDPRGAPTTPAYPGDTTTVPDLTYAPKPGAEADPGEVVWTWVPYEEDYTQGKDRPVLIIGREPPWLVGLPLTSKDHDRDEQQERRAGREWVDIGSGGWDRKGRASEVRVNRMIRVDPGAIRREGSVLVRERYEEVVAAVRLYHS